MKVDIKESTGTPEYADQYVWDYRERATRKLRNEDPDDWDNRLLPDLRINRPNWRTDIELDYSRNELITVKGRDTLDQRYYARGETDPQHLFARVACGGADDVAHARRLYYYISNHWFMPATPVLTNLGTDRGLPISCFLQSVPDSMKGILDTYTEAGWMGCRGGGIGTYWGRLREVGHNVGDVGKTSGIIPFTRIQDSLTQGVSQGGVRRGVGAAYLQVDHPEIEEFLEIRKPRGDFNRKALNLHHGVLITDEFMQCVRNGSEFSLKSPKDGRVVKTVNARQLFERMVETRMATGEPYMVFIDTINRKRPKAHTELGLMVETSNLCSEITLPTGPDHRGEWRSAVCCLSSLNVEVKDKWWGNEQFFEDVYRFLDNVLQDFILRAPEAMIRAVYSAFRERSVGLGIMGFHSMLQSLNIPFESALAKSHNIRIFKHIAEMADKMSIKLGQERGPCPDAVDAGHIERFTYKTAVAPTATISVIAGGTSACIEPIPNNIYVHKSLSGNHEIRNPYLEKHLESLGMNTTETWASILENNGSVQHLDLDQNTKDVFKTPFEIHQRWLIDFAADRAKYVDQAVSTNLYVPPTVDKWDLLMLHFKAWERGVKSLYYLRSKSLRRGSTLISGRGDVSADNTLQHTQIIVEREDYEECLACT